MALFTLKSRSLKLWNLSDLCRLNKNLQVKKAVADQVQDMQDNASRADELEVLLIQAQREATAFRERTQKVAKELAQLKKDHMDTLIKGQSERDGDRWEMNKKSRFCVVM